MINRNFYLKWTVLVNVLSVIWTLTKWAGFVGLTMLMGYLTFPDNQNSTTWAPVIWMVIGFAELLVGLITIVFFYALYVVTAEKNKNRFDH